MDHLPYLTSHCSSMLYINNCCYIQDLRFASDDSSSREYRTSYRSDKSDESENFIPPPANRRRYRTDSSCSRRSLTRAASMDLGSNDGNIAEISTFCEEMFLKSYITGLSGCRCMYIHEHAHTGNDVVTIKGKTNPDWKTGGYEKLSFSKNGNFLISIQHFMYQ